MFFRPQRAARTTERDTTGFQAQARWNCVARKNRAPLRSSRRELLQGINSELLKLLHRLFGACSQAIHSLAFPSLRESENRPPLRGESNAMGRAGVAALNRGAHGASESDV